MCHPPERLEIHDQVTLSSLTCYYAHRLSVIGKETQYFIAESTKSLNLSDSQRCEVEGDGLWIGCTDVSKQGRLCEVRVIYIESEISEY